jgi:signal transduction histidine kinase
MDEVQADPSSVLARDPRPLMRGLSAGVGVGLVGLGGLGVYTSLSGDSASGPLAALTAGVSMTGAGGLLLMGIALVLARVRRRLAVWPAVGAILLAGVGLVHHHWLAPMPLPGAVPAYMRPETAVGLVLGAIGLIIDCGPTYSTLRSRRLLAVVGCIPWALGVVSLIGPALGLSTSVAPGLSTILPGLIAAGLAAMGLGLEALAWSNEHEVEPAWLPLPVVVGVLTMTVALAQGIHAAEVRQRDAVEGHMAAATAGVVAHALGQDARALARLAEDLAQDTPDARAARLGLLGQDFVAVRGAHWADARGHVVDRMAGSLPVPGEDESLWAAFGRPEEVPAIGFHRVGDNLVFIHSVRRGPDVVGVLMVEFDTAARLNAAIAQLADGFDLSVRAPGGWPLMGSGDQDARGAESVASTVGMDLDVRAVKQRPADGKAGGVVLPAALLGGAGLAAALGLAVQQSLRSRAQVRQLEAIRQDLVRSNRDLEHFAWLASHDLKQPLRKLSNNADLLAERYAGQLDERGAGWVRSISQGAVQMAGLIDGVMEFSRLRSSPPVVRVVDLAAVVDQVHADVRVVLAGAGGQLNRGQLALVEADPNLVQRVFLNLFNNAIKFRSPEPLRIQVDAVRVGNRVQVTVADNGVGIPDGEHEQVFSLFHRSAHTRQQIGSGLGLAICREIVERHGGTMSASPRPGGGTGFVFTLPVARE